MNQSVEQPSEGEILMSRGSSPSVCFGAVAALLAGTALATPALAQTETAATSDADIVVTARRVTERLQDVPLSISVTTAEVIAERNSTRVSDLAATIPNLIITPGTLSTITVRGITSQARVNPGFDSGVGVYIDGVVQGKLYTFDVPLYDAERVEFLRGPQGTLFGKNSIAGAISITTRNPSLERPEGNVELEYGDFDRRQVDAYVSVPVSNTIAVSAGGFRLVRDGYVRNLFDGGRVANDDSYGGRAKILWQPSAMTRIIASADVLREDILSYDQEIESGYGGPTGRYETNVSTPTLAYRLIKGVSLTGEFETSFGATLTSITAYRTAKSRRETDTDGGPLNIVFSASGSDQKQFSQEVRLAGGIGDGIKYLLGAYLFRQDTENNSLSTFGPDTRFGLIRGLTGNTFGDADTDSVAFFGSVDWTFVPTVTLTTGVRYTDEVKRLHYQQIGFPVIGAPNLPLEFDKFSATDVSPTFTLRWQPSRSLMIYGTASKGFKSGGWNVDNITSGRITSFKALRFGDESVWNYEAGVKSQFADGRVTFNAAVYQQDYSDIQTPQLTPVLGGGGAVVSIVTNAAEARIRGFEAELSVKPMSMLTINGVVGYTDAKYRDYLDGTLSFAGNRLPFAPKWTSNLSANLRVPVSDDLAFGVRGEWAYVASSFGDRENTALRQRPSLDTVNANVGVYTKHFDLNVFVDNLLDDETVTLRSTGGFAAPVGTGTNQLLQRRIGRLVGVRLSARL